MGRMDGKVAVITGGASGIGAATADRFVEEGAKVLIADMQEELGAQKAAELGDAAEFWKVNVAVESDVAEAVATAVDKWGRLDCMFNNAGFGGALGPIASVTEDEYDLTMNVLLKGVFFGIKHASPVMSEQGSGSIVNTASICGIQAGYGPHLYSVAKAAVISMTANTAMELAEDNIRVNAVCPGFTVTALAAGKPGADDDRLDKMRQVVHGAQPIERAGEALDLANMVLFLASDESAWITGQHHVVDGGLMAGVPWRKQPKAFKSNKPFTIYRPGS